MVEPLTITDAFAAFDRGELTPTVLLEQCFTRIDVYEPMVHAWAYLDRDRARHDAAKLTEEWQAGRRCGPLHGIPIGVKDIIDVFDMPTGCGSKLWANSYARRDATCVRRLRDAGAVILGKTVTTPYAFFDPSVTRNPWNTDRTPGGSSSGSAAAVACGMCLAALGTQTGGSITRPASYCGVYSLKPSHEHVSVDGVLPFAPSLDHVGVMAGSVRDLATVYQVIAEVGVPVTDWNRDRLPVLLTRLGGIFEELAQPDLLAAYDAAVQILGKEVGPCRRMFPPEELRTQPTAHRIIMATEAAVVHAERLARHPDDYPPRIRELIEEGSATSGSDYCTAWNLMEELRQSIVHAFDHAGILVTPATTDFAPAPETTGNPAFNSPWSFLGTPTIGIPAGFSSDGLPMAIQLAAAPQCEGDLFAVAAWCEQVLGRERRLPPRSPAGS